MMGAIHPREMKRPPLEGWVLAVSCPADGPLEGQLMTAGGAPLTPAARAIVAAQLRCIVAQLDGEWRP